MGLTSEPVLIIMKKLLTFFDQLNVGFSFVIVFDLIMFDSSEAIVSLKLGSTDCILCLLSSDYHLLGTDRYDAVKG